MRAPLHPARPRDTVDALLPSCGGPGRAFTAPGPDDRALPARPRKAGKAGQGQAERLPLHPQYVAATVDQLAAQDAIFTFDVGTRPSGPRYLRMNGAVAGARQPRQQAKATLPHAIGAQGRQPGPAGRRAVRRRRAGDAARRAGTLRQQLPWSDRRVRKRALSSWKRDEGGRDRHDWHRPGQSRLRRDSQGHRPVRCPGGQGRGPADALREAFGHDGPALVDVRTVREELSLPPS